jgi:predicted adenine nucleotide alpha hydrolase (AANH) superfamily ATPase
MHGWFSSYLKFWTMLAPQVLFCKFFVKFFSKLFANNQRYMNKIKEAFSRFEIFSPCFKCFSFDLNKTPPQ